MSWARAIQRLNRVVVRELGEDVLLEQPGGPSLHVSGILTDPERTAQLARSDFMLAEAMLVLRASDAPSWLGRGVVVTRATGATYDVIRVVNNGEGLLEVTLCRSS